MTTFLSHCRLCLNSEATNLINIFDNANIATVIKKHFWFEIKEDDVNKYICAICWSKVHDFNSFYIQVYNKHKECYSDVQGIIKVKIEDENISNACLGNNSKFGNIQVTSLESKSKFKNEICEKKIVKTSIKVEDEFPSDEDSIEVDQSETLLNINSENSISDEDNHKKQPNPIILELPKDSRLVLNKNLKTVIKPIDKKKRDEENRQIQEYFSMACEFCPFRTDTFQNIQIHYRKDHKIRGYLRCCNQKFMKRSSLVEHIDRHLNPNKFKCDICNKTYAHKRSLLDHLKCHLSAEKRPFKCTECPKTYSKKSIFEYHFATHNKEKQFVCNDCGKSFSTNNLLQAHKKNVHSEANIYICDVCAKEFRSKLAFEQHQKTVHQNIVLPKVQCQVCGIWLKHKDILRRHMIGHEESKSDHFCSICGKKSLNRKALHKHVTTVHSDIVYTCNLCEKTFKKQISLKEHMASHTGATLYSCPHCTKTFNSKSNMYSHKKKIHVKEYEEHKRLKATGAVETK